MSNIDLKRFRFENDLTQEKLGEILNLTKQQISNIENGKSTLSESNKKILVNKYPNILQSQIEPDSHDCISIDYIHIKPSCGKGTVVLQEPDVTPIKLGTHMIQSVLKITNPKCLKIFKASGDSMESIIEDGDMLLIDTSRTDYNNGGIFLLTINNDWFVKRLRRRLTGELDVISDNSKYPIETFYPDSDIEINIKGRVIKNLSRGL